MRTMISPDRLRLLIVPLCCVAGCASMDGVSSKMRTVASVGDKKLPVVSGEPGASVASEPVAPERQSRPDGRISGRVVDDRGDPVPGARVRLAVGAAPGGKVVRTTTDPSGAFTLRGLRPGTSYTVIAEWEDGQGVMTGRSAVRAPDTEVRIGLVAADGADPGTATASSSRVSPASRREMADDEPEDEGRGRGRDHAPPRVNVEDVEPPPADEADELPRPTTRRARSRTVEDASSLPRTGWQRRGPDSPGAASAPASATEEGPRDPAPVDAEPRGAAGPAELPPADDDGPNPLPPAIEPGEASGMPLSRAPEAAAPDPFAAAPPATPPPAERPPATAEATAAPEPAAWPSEAVASSQPPTPPHPDRSAPDATAGVPGALTEVPRASALIAFDSTPTMAPAPEPSSGVRPASLPAMAAEPEPSETRRRPTWREVADASAAPATAAAIPPGRPQAAPRPADDGLPYCHYDSKYRRIDDFRLPDLQGKSVRFRDLDSDLVLIDFWGTWCQPCLKTIPHLVELQQRYPSRRLTVLGVACERGEAKERAAKAAQESQKLGINYQVLVSGMDGSCPLQKALHIQAYPTLVLVDRQGRIVWRDQGATPTTLARLDRFLASASPSDGTRRF